MMDVNQPICTNALELPKMITSVSETESLKDVCNVKQNGTSKRLEQDSETNGFDVEDAMEKLMYSDSEDIECDSKPEAGANETEMVQDISTNLVDDIIQLTKDTTRANNENGTQGQVPDESSELMQSLVQSSEQSGAEEEGTNVICAIEEDTLAEVDDELPETISDVDLGVNECVLLEEDDTDDNSLLVNGKDEGDNLQNSAIHIEDSVVNVESTEATLDELTDNSIAAIDESGLSILNTAAVDIADMTVNDSVKSVDDLAVEADFSASSKEPPVFAMMEEMVTSIADNLKDDEKKTESDLGKTVDDKLNKSLASAGIVDLIRSQDVDMVETQTESRDDIADQPKTDSCESIIVQLPDEATTTDEETLKDSEPELSDLIKFDSIADVEEKKPDKEAIKGEHSDLVESPEDSVSDKTEKHSSESEKKTTEEISKVSSVEDSVKASSDSDLEKQGSELKSNNEENKSDAIKNDDACPQALQAADEEDLLEVMSEPEEMDPDEDNQEEDGDDNSSESGSAKRSQEEGDDEDEDGQSEYVAADDDETSRNVGDNAEDARTVQDDLDEGEPPVKKMCSVDVRKTEEVESAKEEPKLVAKKPEENIEQPEQNKPDKETSVETGNVKDKIEEVANDGKDGTKTEESVKTLTKQIASEKVVQKEDVQPERMDVCETETISNKKAKDDSEDKAKCVDSEKSESNMKVDKSESNTEVDKSENTDVNLEKKIPVEVEKATNDFKTVEKSDDIDPQKKKSPSVHDQDEVLVIDDDDDVPVKGEKSLKSLLQENKKEDEGVAVGKRPCPEDKSENKEESGSVKKIRLSTEKMQQPEEQTKDENKSSLESVEPLKVSLVPEPEISKEKKPVRLDFMAKFLKPLERMNRSDLEEFVLQKIVEGIAFKSTIAEMRTQLDSQDTLLQGYRQKVHDLKKQFKDLEMVHERVVKDLEKKNQHFITPVKITRAVGLQVSQPRFVAGGRPSVGGSTSGNNTPKGVVSRSPAVTPASSPSKATSPNNTQTRRLTYTRVPPLVVNTKTSVQQSVINRIGTTTIISKTVSSSVNKTVTSVQSQVTSATTQQLQSAASTSPLSVAGSPALRKKPLQKFTPMRPPLSITQQVQQQQQTRQMQEQLVRQQIQEVQTNVGSGSQPQSPITQSPQGSPLTRTPEPSPTSAGVSPARVPPIVMKKVAPQTKGTPGTMQIVNRQTPSMVTAATATSVRSAVTTAVTPAAPVVTVDNSLIDLTDEDDAPKAVVVTPASAITTAVVPRSPITLLNGQQQQYVQRQSNSLPPLVVINQQRMISRPTLQQRPPVSNMVNGPGVSTRPMLMQRPANVTNGLPRALSGQQAYKPRMINGQTDPNRRLVARTPIRQPIANFVHPAPLPQPGAQPSNGAWKHAPPRPSIRINNIETGIVISWTMDDLSDNHATIVSYQIYAYQETVAPPSIDMWRHVGDVKAMLLPMAVTLTQFQEGQRYHFAVRAVDEHQRVGQFSPPRTWNESAPGKA